MNEHHIEEKTMSMSGSTGTDQLVGTFVADPIHSSFSFAVKHMQVATFRASFDEVEVRVTGDSTGIAFEGAASAESISIRTPAEFRQHVVYGADFLDAANHPEITFRSDAVQLGEDGSVTVRGGLTIKGITKPFTATGTLRPVVEDPTGTLRTAVDLTATVDRRDWGMDWQVPLPKGGDILGYEVQLIAQAELVQESPR